jgi:heme-degrading monooxygenase HmoA
MIEIIITYDFLPGENQNAYAEYAMKTIGALLKAPGFIEFRGNRNILGLPQIRSTSVWQTLSDWAKFTESPTWQALDAESRNYITNIRVEIWGPSPVTPDPIRPDKR